MAGVIIKNSNKNQRLLPILAGALVLGLILAVVLLGQSSDSVPGAADSVSPDSGQAAEVGSTTTGETTGHIEETT